MNKKNWIAIFLGVAFLILFVAVTGYSTKWFNNKTDKMPQQINQTLKNIKKDTTTAPNNKMPTKIDSNKIMNSVKNATNNFKNMQ